MLKFAYGQISDEPHQTFTGSSKKKSVFGSGGVSASLKTFIMGKGVECLGLLLRDFIILMLLLKHPYFIRVFPPCQNVSGNVCISHF